MIKLQTGVSTDMDFIKAMKEKGQDVNAQFPAETLRKQLDELNEEVKVTFKSTNETVLAAVNEEEPEPKEQVTVHFKVYDADSELDPITVVGGNTYTSWFFDVVADKGTELEYTSSCPTCKTVTGTVLFDEEKTVEIHLELDMVTLNINIDGIETADEPKIYMSGDIIGHGDTVKYEVIRGFSGTLRIECDGYETYTEKIELNDDLDLTITLTKLVTVSFSGGDMFTSDDEVLVTIDGVEHNIPFELAKPRNTELEYTASCVGYVSSEGTVLFDYDKPFIVNLDPVEPDIVGIEVTKLPDKTVYKLGDDFDSTGIKLDFIYSDGSRRPVDIEQESIDYTPSQFDEVGTISVVVRCNSDFEDSFDVTVEPNDSDSDSETE